MVGSRCSSPWSALWGWPSGSEFSPRDSHQPARRPSSPGLPGRGAARPRPTAAKTAGARPTVTPLMAGGWGRRRAWRQQFLALLAADGAGRARAEPLADKLVHRASDCWLHLPATVHNFTDFFAGIHHATNGGRRRDPN